MKVRNFMNLVNSMVSVLGRKRVLVLDRFLFYFTHNILQPHQYDSYVLKHILEYPKILRNTFKLNRVYCEVLLFLLSGSEEVEGRRLRVASLGPDVRPQPDSDGRLPAWHFRPVSLKLKSTSDVVDVLDPAALDDIRFCIIYNLFGKFTQILRKSRGESSRSIDYRYLMR